MKAVLILGAEVQDRFTGNRGAEQLLRTAAGRLRGMGFQPAVTVGQVDRFLIKELGLAEYVGNPRISVLDKWVPKLQVGQYVSIKALAGVLDASGYALGDAWGEETAKWIYRKYAQFTAAGVPIIALPQAYGPFADDVVSHLSHRALKMCRAVFPRDQLSFEYITALGSGINVCTVTPDITIGEGLSQPGHVRSNRLVIVPNWNLMRSTNNDAYLESLRKAVVVAEDRGMEVHGLLHEGHKDLEVLHRLQLNCNLRIVASLTGWDVKTYIGESRLIISGRYHAVVAALTTGTPVITHSWSHKYREVLALFGREGWMHQPDNSSGVEEAIDDALALEDEEHMRMAHFSVIPHVDAMWMKVQSILEHELK